VLDKDTILKRLVMPESRRMMSRLYGVERVADQTRRWERLVRAAFDEFGMHSAILTSSPGRTEIGGNHTDHNDGRVLCAAVHLDAIACIEPADNNKVMLRSEGWDETFELDLSDLKPRDDETGSTRALIRGVAAAMVRRGHAIGGFRGRMASSIPSGSGLSSSASVEVLLGQIQNIIYNAGKIEPLEIAVIGREAENLHFGKPCGLMDQMACAIGGIAAIDFGKPLRPRWKKIAFSLEKAGLALVVVKIPGDHADLTDEYAAIPSEMKAVAEMFGLPSLRRLSMEKLMKKSAAVRGQLGDRALLRAMHFIRENDRAADEADALEAGKLKQFLKLIRKSGDSSWRLLQNVSIPGAIKDQSLAVAIALSSEFLGKKGAARIHGGGFAGTIQAFVPLEQVEDYAEFMNTRFGAEAASAVHIRPDGAGKIEL
jgi:galactokinase